MDCVKLEVQVLSREKLKCTNSDQYNRLVEFMVENPTVASYFTTVKTPNDRMEYHEAWQNLTEQLNMRGPPMRTLDEWKKVWKDYKYHTKKKFNIKQKIEQKIRTAGESGNYKKINFNRNELSIISILNLEASKSNGKKNTKIPTITKPPVIKTEPSEIIFEISEMDFIDTFSPPTSPTNPETTNIFPECHREIDLLKEEIHFDSHIRKLKMEKINILRQTSEINQRHLELKEKMYDLKERKFELKCQQFKDKYKYKTQKLELKKRTLELKEAAKLRKKEKLQIEN